MSSPSGLVDPCGDITSGNPVCDSADLYQGYETVDATAIVLCRDLAEETKQVVLLQDMVATSDGAVKHMNQCRLQMTMAYALGICERVVVQASTLLQVYVQTRKITPVLSSGFTVLHDQLAVCETVLADNQRVLGELYTQYSVDRPSSYDKITSMIARRSVLADIVKAAALQAQPAPAQPVFVGLSQ